MPAPSFPAHYEMVGTNTTGHAGSVQVTFDPRRISYGHILQIYFSVADDPIELNRQGPDVGTQYRSAIFPTNPEQARIACPWSSRRQNLDVPEYRPNLRPGHPKAGH
jgi:peptide-methionine (S)-S-oxide reductase